MWIQGLDVNWVILFALVGLSVVDDLNINYYTRLKVVSGPLSKTKRRETSFLR